MMGGLLRSMRYTLLEFEVHQIYDGWGVTMQFSRQIRNRFGIEDGL
jgi:hypothetical protein